MLIVCVFVLPLANKRLLCPAPNRRGY